MSGFWERKLPHARWSRSSWNKRTGNKGKDKHRKCEEGLVNGLEGYEAHGSGNLERQTPRVRGQIELLQAHLVAVSGLGGADIVRGGLHRVIA